MRQFTLHLVSDATGETIDRIARACLAQFDEINPQIRFWNLIRTSKQLEIVCDQLRLQPGLVFFTFADAALRDKLVENCRNLKVPSVAIMDPAINALSAYLGRPSRGQPGRQHVLNDAYFDRIDAMDYALAHDDGQLGHDLSKADVVLVGVSRTSKTPTCIYLAGRGIKAANIPFVVGQPLPKELSQLQGRLVVGLTNDVERLIHIRQHRLELMGQHESNYADADYIKNELAAARKLFNQMGWPVINVARRSIEETAAEIIALLERRKQSA